LVMPTQAKGRCLSKNFNMLLYICIYLSSFVLSQETTASPTNYLVEVKDQCEAIGSNLNECRNNCTFYDISTREVWGVFTRLTLVQVYTAVEGWISGEVISVHQFADQDDITVEYLWTRQNCGCKNCVCKNCPCGQTCDREGEMCRVTDDRYSMRFRSDPNQNVTDIRVTYSAEMQRDKLETMKDDAGLTPEDIHTRISQVSDNDWTELWIYGSLGEIIGLSPFDLVISKVQDCLISPDVIDYYAHMMVTENNQVPEAIFCTKRLSKFDCDLEPNCTWEDTVCLANSWTNDLLTCNVFKTEDECVAMLEPNCKWIKPSNEEQYNNEDTYCICCSATHISVVLLLMLLSVFVC